MLIVSKISERSIRRTVHGMGYGSRRTVRTLFLPATNKKVSNSQRSRRTRQRIIGNNLSGSINHIFSYIMWEFFMNITKAWTWCALLQIFKLEKATRRFVECFSWHVLGPLIQIHGNPNKIFWLKIATGEVHPVILIIYNKGDGYFQQDNAGWGWRTRMRVYFA